MSGWDIGLVFVGSIDVLTNIPKKVMSMSTQPHLMDIIYFLLIFLMVWAPSQKVIYLKPWEDIRHCFLQSANKFEHGL